MSKQQCEPDTPERQSPLTSEIHTLLQARRRLYSDHPNDQVVTEPELALAMEEVDGDTVSNDALERSAQFLQYATLLGMPPVPLNLQRDYLKIQYHRLLSTCIDRGYDSFLYALCEHPIVQERLHYRVNGWTFLHRAAAIGSRLSVLILLSAGSDVNAMTNVGEGPLHLAVRFGNVGAASALCQFGCLDVPDRITGRTALSMAARRLEHAEALRDAMLNSQTIHAQFGPLLAPEGIPLSVAGIRACYQQIYEQIESMPTHPMSAETACAISRNHDNDKLLHRLARVRDVHGIQSVLACQEQGAEIDFNVRNYRGETPLMVLALSEFLCFDHDEVRLAERLEACFELLLEGGADVHCRDVYGRTLLDFAVQNQSFVTYRVLIAQHVCPLRLNTFRHAVYANRVHPWLLQGYMNMAYTHRHRLALDQGDAFIHYVVRAFADANSDPAEPRKRIQQMLCPLLEEYAKAQGVPLARLLTQTNADGQTALYLAIRLGDGQLAQRLWKRVDNFFITNAQGQSPIEYARSLGYAEVVDYLKSDVVDQILARIEPAEAPHAQREIRQRVGHLLGRLAFFHPTEHDVAYRYRLINRGLLLDVEALHESSSSEASSDEGDEFDEEMDWDSYGAELQRLYEEDMLLEERTDDGEEHEMGVADESVYRSMTRF